MAEPILHHYLASPFGEKIRLMLGFKGVAWRSVLIPEVMPKPDVVALTGGYRRTPVLQVGADIYCDTALITRVLERLAPSPTLYPYGDTLAMQALAHFADNVIFNINIPLAIFDPETFRIFFPNMSMERFREDRAAMRKGGTVRRGTLAECRAAYDHVTSTLENQLAQGHPYLFGERPCVADFVVYHNYWPITRVPKLAGLLQPYKALSAWLDLMKAIGHGSSVPLSSTQALELARSSRAQPIRDGVVAHGEGFELGDVVEVMPVDYAFDPVRGTLLDCSIDEIALRRTDPRAGTVVVHFPRTGFQLKKLGSS